MAINLTNVVGSAQAGLTTPGFNVTADLAPAQNAKQWAVTALTGTQAGVGVHSVASPFTIAMFRPQNPQALKPVNVLSGMLAKVPVNTYKVITRKGVLPLAGQSFKNLVITTTIDVPAGSDTADANSVRAAMSAHIGALSQQSSGVGDTLINGML